MNTQEWIIQLIAKYLEAAATLSERLSQSFSQQDLLSGRRAKAIPRTGLTPDGIEFRFHGSGCWISDGKLLVDLDFTPTGKVDGFDAWRLHVFSKENRTLVDQRSLGEVEAGLKDLLARRTIEAIDNSSLYRLRQNNP